MNKFLLTMLSVVTMLTTASAQDSNLSAMTDAIYVAPATIPAGSQQTLSVRMKNSIAAQTIQFDLYLPDGVSFVKNEDDEWMTASKERINKFNYFESTIQKEDGALRLLAQATTTNIAVGDGEIAQVIVKADAGMMLGDYQVTVKKIFIVSKDNTSNEVDEVKTTLTIGAPADTRTVLDETSTTAPASATGVDVRVIRTIKANEWSTICLPFAMSEEQVKTAFGDDVQLGDFTGYVFDDEAETITVNFKDATAIQANHPYIIKVSSKVEEFTIDGVDIDPEDEPMVNKGTSRKPKAIIGTYVANTVIENGNLFLSGNQFWYSVGNTKMKAFRAYFNFFDLLPDFETNYAESRIVMSFGDETTGIESLTPDLSPTGEGSIYNLNGQRVEHPAKKGLYIKNGRKEVIK